MDVHRHGHGAVVHPHAQGPVRGGDAVVRFGPERMLDAAAAAAGTGPVRGPDVPRHPLREPDDEFRDLPENDQLVVLAEAFDAHPVHLGGAPAPVARRPVPGAREEAEAVLGGGLQRAAVQPGDGQAQHPFHRPARPLAALPRNRNVPGDPGERARPACAA